GEILSNLNEKAPDIRKLASGANELNAGTGEILDNLNKKSSDINDLAAGANEVNAGTGLLLSTLDEKSADISKLNDGANELANGDSKLSDGGNELADGGTAVKEGAESLAVGPNEGRNGSSKLEQGLNEESVAGSQELAAGVLEAQEGVNDTIDSMYRLEESLTNLQNMDKDDPFYDAIMEETLNQLRAGLDGSDQKQAD